MCYGGADVSVRGADGKLYVNVRTRYVDERPAGNQSFSTNKNESEEVRHVRPHRYTCMQCPATCDSVESEN